jgi:hypothetical protein
MNLEGFFFDPLQLSLIDRFEVIQRGVGHQSEVNALEYRPAASHSDNLEEHIALVRRPDDQVSDCQSSHMKQLLYQSWSDV